MAHEPATAPGSPAARPTATDVVSSTFAVMKPGQASAARESSLETETYRALRDLIVLGKLPPGLMLVETELTTRFGVSRTPVRSALQRLQHERFVQTTRVGGVLRAVVTPLTADDMAELFSIVGALEGVAGELAARLDRQSRATLCAHMRTINTSLSAAAASRPRDIVRAQDLHVQFHRSYVEAAAGPRLIAELDAVQPHAERYERVYTTALIGEFDESLSEHAAIIDAIDRGDAEGAARLVAVNWRNGAARYRRVVEIVGEKGIWK